MSDPRETRRQPELQISSTLVTFGLEGIARRAAQQSLETRRGGEHSSVFPFDKVATWLQHDIARGLQVEAPSLRAPEQDTFARVSRFVYENERAVLVIRHAEQKHRHGGELSPEALKYNMMTPAANRQDRITSTGLAEAYALAEGIKRIAKYNNRDISIESSRNQRALILGAILADHTPGSLTENESLSCINYPVSIGGKAIVPTPEMLKQMGLNPDGSIPFDPEVIDRVAGEGAFERISNTASHIISRVDTMETGLEIVITHTQQLDALALKLGQMPTRLGFFGGFLLGNSGRVLKLPQGLHGPVQAA